jgi:uncharacterized protein
MSTVAPGSFVLAHSQIQLTRCDDYALYRRRWGAESMPIAKLTVELSIPHAHSLKDRRQVVRSIKDKLRHGFNVSVAELDDNTIWNRATLGVVALSGSAAYLAGQMQEIDRTIHRLADSLSAEVLESWVDEIPE